MNNNISKKLKLRLKNTIILVDKTFNICIRNLATNEER
jgi:hypothetical protein